MFSIDSALGVEIRDDQLVLATVKKGLNDFTLKNYTVIDHYTQLERAELRAHVQQYVKSNGFNRENVILGLPRDQAVVRYVELPLETDIEENLEQVVRFQVEKFEPTEEEASCFDYVIVNRDAENKKMLIQIIMVRKAVMDEHLNLFRELNLYPAAVRVSSVALHQILALHEDGYPQKNPCAILNISADAIEIAVVASREKFFSEKVAVQEDQLTFGRVLAELDSFVSRLSLPGEGLSKIYFTGPRGEEFLPEFRSRFEHCELLLRRINLRISANRGSVQSLDEVLNSVGLAMSGMSKIPVGRFNLIPKDKRVVGERASLLPTVLLSVLLVIVGIALGTREHFQRQRLAEEVSIQIQSLQRQVDEVMVLRKSIEERKAQLAELEGMMKGRQRVLVILKELTEKLPESAFLQSANIIGDKVSIQGYADSASALLPILQNSKYLKNVENRYITPDPATRKERFQFEATIKE